MGCGISAEFKPPATLEEADELRKQQRPQTQSGRSSSYANTDFSRSNVAESVSGHYSAVHPATSFNGMAAPVESQLKLLGKIKYIKEYGAFAREDRNPGVGSQGTFFLFCDNNTDQIVFSYWEPLTAAVYVTHFSDVELAQTKSLQGVRHSWAPFFKSLATAMLKGKVVLSSPFPGHKEAVFTITSKDAPGSYPFAVKMFMLDQGKTPAEHARTMVTYVMDPMARALQYKRAQSTISDAGRRVERLECETAVCTASVAKYKETVERLLPLIRPLREDSATHSHVAMSVGREVRDAERQLRERQEQRIVKHPLDALYDEGGAQPFQHVVWSASHVPHEEEPDKTLTACIRATFPLASDVSLKSISQVLDEPHLREMIDASGNRHVITEAFEIFKGIDQWDYDTIQLEIITNGNALFYTTYLLMYKLDLVRHFNIDDRVLQNFLVAVQSSYHPNPYHNAMHGADVTQINYYIMMVAGLCEKCQLSKEEIFAGLLAGAVHDFDHPGLNNNFHTRTNAYLATLYNDRSILENHHVACTFELLRIPKYNILASLSDEKRQTVRETILDMVLATDMGNHAKIFKSFQVRMSETTDWHSKKEDVRLALCMSVKMADISNCARPNHIYAEWAKNISKEFYLQGDAERKLALSISPFMDRTKEDEEFPKGQISFMMYIVQPMVEAISELLPSLSFAVQLCSENKEYWKRKTGA